MIIPAPFFVVMYIHICTNTYEQTHKIFVDLFLYNFRYVSVFRSQMPIGQEPPLFSWHHKHMDAE